MPLKVVPILLVREMETHRRGSRQLNMIHPSRLEWVDFLCPEKFKKLYAFFINCGIVINTATM